MTRAAWAWGGGAAAIVALGALSIGVALATTAGPEHHVQRYLDALARDDLVTAARLAGLEAGTALPVGDEGEPSIRRIIATRAAADGTVAIDAEYGDAADAERVTFRLEPAPPLYGVIPAWRFVDPPVASIEVGVDQHGALVVGDEPVSTPGPGESARVAVFVPARVTVRLAEPLLTAEAVAVRVGVEQSAPVVLAARPSPALDRAVGQLLADLLEGCTEQPVLKPAGCPFGIDIDDRVTAGPQWAITGLEAPELLPGDRPGDWRVRADGVATAEVTVQRLFDGAIDERTESSAFRAEGTVRIAGGEPQLTLDPARP
jgi:hypothetical protein